MITLRRFFIWFVTVALMLGVQFAYAEGVKGELQLVNVPSIDNSVQRSLLEVSVYLEYEMINEPRLSISHIATHG